MNCDDKCLRKVRDLLITNFIKLSKTLLISKTWIFVLLPVVLILTKSPALAAEASEETIATFQAAIEALKAVEHPGTGKGSAQVETYVRNIPLMTGTRVVDFMFKGEMTRSLKSARVEGNSKKPDLLWAVGEKCFVEYTRGRAIVQRNPPLILYRELGNDFNPNTFMQCFHDPIVEHLEGVLDGPATLSTKMDKDGVLNLITVWKDKNHYQRNVMSVDSNKGYRLVGTYALMQRIDMPARNHTDFFEVQWDEHESSWYVKSAKFASYVGIHSPEDRLSLEPGNLRSSTAIEVTEFHPNVEINDSEFTLNGLGLPVGTPVVDKISGISYKIASVPVDTDVPKEPLLEAEFSTSVKNQIDTQNVQQDTEAIAEQTGPEKGMSISNEESTQETLADTLSDRNRHRNVLMIVAFVGIILVIVVGLKLLQVRKLS